MARDEARLEQSGFPALTTALTALLEQGREQLKVERAAQQCRALGRQAESEVGRQIARRQKELAALAEELAQTQMARRELAALRCSISEQIAGLRARTHELVSGMTANDLREIANQVPQWIAAYHLPGTAKVAAAFSEAQAQQLAREIAEYVTSRIEQEFAAWQADKLTPLVAERMQRLGTDLDTSLNDFARQVHALRRRVTVERVGEADLSGDFRRSVTSPPINEMLVMEPFSPRAGVALSGMGVGRALITGAIGAAALTFAGLSPLVIAPLLLGGGLLLGNQATAAAAKTLKEQLSQAYVGQIRAASDVQAERLADLVTEKQTEIQRHLDQRMAQEMARVGADAEDWATRRQGLQAELQQVIDQLCSAREELKVIEKELSLV